MQLTTKRVAMLVKRPGRYHDGHGLILVVVNANNASWQLRYQRNGRERWLGLGPLHTVTLKDARERARAARLQLLDGIDPIDVRRAERAKATQVMTFRDGRRGLQQRCTSRSGAMQSIANNFSRRLPATPTLCWAT